MPGILGALLKWFFLQFQQFAAKAAAKKKVRNEAKAAREAARRLLDDLNPDDRSTKERLLDKMRGR